MIDKILKNLEIVQFIATALKSIPKLVEMQVWERNVVKCARYDPIKFANFVIMNYPISNFFKILSIMQSVHCLAVIMIYSCNLYTPLVETSLSGNWSARLNKVFTATILRSVCNYP
jgi:hypothetical protein